MSCRLCPQCRKDRTRIGVFPYTCSCGLRAASVGELVSIEDCEPPSRTNGVGYHLTRFLEWFGFRDSNGCGCESFAAELDRLGPAGCRKEFRRLAKKLASKAKAKGIPFSRLAAGWALKRAIRKAEAP